MPATSSARRAPTYWTPLPAGFSRAPKIVALRAEFGAPGPWAFIVLLATATEQGFTGGDKGVVRMAWPTLAEEVSVPVEAAQVVVRRIAAMGEADLLADDDFGFTARFRDWGRWDMSPRDPTAAERKRRQREREKEREREQGS